MVRVEFGRKGIKQLFGEPVVGEAAKNTKSGTHAKAIMEMAYSTSAQPQIELINQERNAFSFGSNLIGKMMSITPNPTQDKMIISFIAPETVHQSLLEFVDSNGRSLRQFDLSNYFGDSLLPVDIDDFSPGIYVVSIILNGVLAGIEKIAVIR